MAASCAEEPDALMSPVRVPPSAAAIIPVGSSLPQAARRGTVVARTTARTRRGTGTQDLSGWERRACPSRAGCDRTRGRSTTSRRHRRAPR
ncbi:hypothetical protein [Ornithinimicrobium kibberense]|uniref:hypothetical protein n=1 Tax=Ornithinimicrobium kibberense TaxID=282060 RepID=UPI00361B6815